MPRIRLTIANGRDTTEQLRVAMRLRQRVIDSAPVQVDPRFPLQGMHRNAAGRPYFEFQTANAAAVSEVIGRNEFANQVELTETEEPLGEPCANCGNIAGPIQPAVCPNCGFHEISPCPICGVQNAKAMYERIAGDLFFCPTKAADGGRHRVRLLFNDPMFNPDGTYHQPLIVVSEVHIDDLRSRGTCRDFA